MPDMEKLRSALDDFVGGFSNLRDLTEGEIDKVLSGEKQPWEFNRQLRIDRPDLFGEPDGLGPK